MKYSHVLSPVKIGNVTLKSHLTHSKCYSIFGLNEAEFERAAEFFCAVAKNGAATVAMSVGTFPDCEGKRSVMSTMNMDDPWIQEQYTKLINKVHQYGTLCSASLMNVEPQNLAISDTPNWDQIPLKGDYNPNVSNRPGISLERIEGMINDFVNQCKELQRIGFNMVTFYMSYRASILGNAISPTLNQRTDKYGGSTIAERARLPLEVFRRVKEACGQDFLIEIQTSAEEEEPGYKVNDWLEFCKLCEGLVDIFQVRGWDGSYTHVTGYNSELDNPHTLKFAEAFKKRGIKALVAPVGGFGNPDQMERFIAEGKTDLIAMARGLMVDLELGKKMEEDRGEDVAPCLFCMKCNNPSCSVNPYLGLLGHHDAIPPVGASKKVAIIGGGASGMRAAIDAASRGHKVTLFEKDTELGGQLRFARYPSFKWPLREYLFWLIRQVKKCGADMRLGTEATRELLAEGHYDAIICALGSEPKGVPVNGADTAKVWQIDDVYGHEAEMGKRIVVVGGGQSGRETALYLAEAGHKVTMLTRKQEVYTENSHCIYAIINAYENEPNLDVIEFAETTEIGDNYVVCNVKTNMPKRKITFSAVGEMNQKEPAAPEIIPGFLYPEYPDFSIQKLAMQAMKEKADSGEKPPKTGVAHAPEIIPTIDEKDLIIENRRIECDSVIVTGGRRSRTEAAAKFAGLAPQIYVIGDNVEPASVMECTLTAFAAAIQL